MNFQTIQKTVIYKELGSTASEVFEYSRSKFITHIDTLYYVCYVDAYDWQNDERKKRLCEVIKEKKELTRATGKSQPIFDIQGLEARDFAFGFYNLHFGKKDCFDIFVSDYLPNKNTCPIVVQLRSQYLWLKGARNAFDESCDILNSVLGAYGLEIIRTQENRIDYAYHTNYIQDLLNCFPDKKLKDMQVSSFERWHKEGYFFYDDTFCDYFTLGRRKSNNVFFRVYNKTKEVIEMGYKQFFITLWRENGLISEFDKYVLEKCFTNGSYAYKEKARCEFYLEYGQNETHKECIRELIDDDNATYSQYKAVADCLVPDLTTICNIEFQCKRKFFYNLVFPRVTKDISHKANVYNCLDLFYSIELKLTTDTIRFVKYKGKWKDVPRIERPSADWWERLQSAKMFEFDPEHYELYRDYQNTLDLHRQKIMTIGKLAGLSAYSSDLKDTPFETDIQDFVLSLNDNDVQLYNRKRNEKWRELKAKGLV